MSSFNGFLYESEGHRYWLVADVIISKSRIKVMGADIYSREFSYLGYWDRFNMPPDLLNKLTAWYKRSHTIEILERRAAMYRKERKPKF